MAMKWRPAYCACVLDYETSGGPDPRWPFTGISAIPCPAHKGLTPQELVAVLHEESFAVEQTRAKSLTVGTTGVTKLTATLLNPQDSPPVTVTWTGTGKTRAATVTFAAALTNAEKNTIRNALVLMALPRAVSIA